MQICWTGKRFKAGKTGKSLAMYIVYDINNYFYSGNDSGKLLFSWKEIDMELLLIFIVLSFLVTVYLGDK